MIYGAKTVPVERLQLSRAPAAELAGQAIAAQAEAGLSQGADFVVIAVEPGQSDTAYAAATAAVRAAEAR